MAEELLKRMSGVQGWTSSLTLAILGAAVILCTYIAQRSSARRQWVWTPIRLSSIALVLRAILSAAIPGGASRTGSLTWLDLADLTFGTSILLGVVFAFREQPRPEEEIRQEAVVIEPIEINEPGPESTVVAEVALVPDVPAPAEVQESQLVMPVPATDMGAIFAESKEILVLVADGSEEIHDLVRAYLLSTAYVPHFVRTGTEAISKFKSGRYRIVLVDIQLPVLDGTAVIGMIREWEQTNSQARTPMVAMIAKTATEYAEQGTLGAGASSHVRKPLSRAKLLQALEVCRGQFLANKVTSVCSTATEITEEMLPEIPAFLVGRLREVDTLKREYFAQNIPQILVIADEIAEAGSTYGIPRLVQIGRTLASAASEDDWNGLADTIRDLEFYLESLQSSVPALPS